MARGSDGLAVNVHIDIVPMGKPGLDFGGALGIVGAEIVHGLVGEDHAPAERVARLVALEHDDVMRGIAQLHGDGEDEAGGTAADAGYAHEESLYMNYLGKARPAEAISAGPAQTACREFYCAAS